MTKFNKSLLTAAVVGALALPGIAAAASLSFAAGEQITFAKDLIVNDGTTIYTPNGLQLAAQAVDAGNIATVAGDLVRVKITLTNGAKFDTTADATTLVGGFTAGAQLGGAPTPLAGILVGTPYYSTTGQELNFDFTAPGAGNAGAGYALEINSTQITNLIQGLFTGSSVGAEITVQNSSGQQILASKAEIAKSLWGVTVTSDTSLGDTSKTIDVAATPRKTLFSPTGSVGGSAGSAPQNGYFNAGAILVDITSALETDGATTSYINNYSAVDLNPEYNVVNTADIVVRVAGDDLAAFAGSAHLDTSATCAGPGVAAATSLDGAGNLVFTSSATDAIWNPITSAPPAGPATVYVCLSASGDEMNAQALTGTLEVNYNLSTQRVNPDPYAFELLPLRLNGTTLIFQNVNPAGNTTAQSFLRLTNNNSQICPVTIDAKDDAGLHSGELTLTLDAHESIQVNSEDLENGNAGKGLTGGFGDGTGKWYVRVTAECSNFKASALNRNSDNGVVTNLTPEKQVGIEWLTPPNSL